MAGNPPETSSLKLNVSQVRKLVYRSHKHNSYTVQKSTDEHFEFTIKSRRQFNSICITLYKPSIIC